MRHAESAGRRRRVPNPSTPPSSPSSDAFDERALATMRPRPAPSAARTASSCCRPPPCTSNRLATLAQAISITMPMVPISTHSSVRHIADHVRSLSGRRAGRDAPALVDPRTDAGGCRPRVHPDRHHPRDVGAGLAQSSPLASAGRRLESRSREAISRLAIEGERQDHVGLAVPTPESLGHHADDLPWARIDDQAASDDDLSPPKRRCQ